MSKALVIAMQAIIQTENFVNREVFRLYSNYEKVKGEGILIDSLEYILGRLDSK
jgi:hypothetical protein